MATLTFYDHWLQISGTAGVAMDTDAFIITLHNNSTFNASQTQYSQVQSTELATGDGYTQQNKVIANTTWTQTTGTVKFDGDNVTWTSTNPGSIGPSTAAIIYDSTAASSPLMAYIDFQGTETASNGAEFQIIWNANGIYIGSF